MKRIPLLHIFLGLPLRRWIGSTTFICWKAPLFSDHLRIAGRVDCIAEFDGELAVIDFKTSTKPKQESWIENYFVQEAAYAAMYYERCGVEVQKVVTIIAVEDGTMQVIEKRNLNELYKLLQEYIHDFNTSYR